jgi:hypothetical protein
MHPSVHARHEAEPVHPPAAVLLLKGVEASVQLLCCATRQLVQRVFVDGSRAVVLLDNLLKLSEAQEELLL